MLKIYKLTRKESANYHDVYQSFVVVSCSAFRAKKTHPQSTFPNFIKEGDWDEGEWANDWVSDPLGVKAEYIGAAAKDRREGDIICTNYGI